MSDRAVYIVRSAESKNAGAHIEGATEDIERIVEKLRKGPPPAQDSIKQVIVIRHDLHVRAGKMAAQAAHASMAFLTNRIRDRITDYFDAADDPLFYVVDQFRLYPPEKAWIEGIFTKVCVRVDSEEELMDIYTKAQAAGLQVHLIEDAGLTEFHGVKTKTCLAIGPDLSSKIDPITGHLRLL